MAFISLGFEGKLSGISCLYYPSLRQNQLLGPGTYDIETGSFTSSAVQERSYGPNWARAFEVAKWAAIPHVLYKDEWKRKKELVSLPEDVCT